MTSTKIFLLYNDEDISRYKHPDIIPLKLDQTEYFESEAFRMLTPEMVPDADQIGCITPSFLDRFNWLTLNDLFNVKIEGGFHKWLEVNRPCEQFFGHETSQQIAIWKWMIEELGLSWTYNKYNGFYSNFWITSRDTFIEYIAFAKKVIKLIDNAPPHIKTLLDTHSGYNGKLIGTGILEKRFGKSWYPWQPFILERVVCLFAYVKECELSSNKMSKDAYKPLH